MPRALLGSDDFDDGGEVGDAHGRCLVRVSAGHRELEVVGFEKFGTHVAQLECLHAVDLLLDPPEDRRVEVPRLPRRLGLRNRVSVKVRVKTRGPKGL